MIDRHEKLQESHPIPAPLEFAGQWWLGTEGERRLSRMGLTWLPFTGPRGTPGILTPSCNVCGDRS